MKDKQKTIKLLLSIIKVLLVILITLYFSIRLYNYIDSQVNRTLNVILRSISDLLPYANKDYMPALKVYLKDKTMIISSYVIKGDMIKAFVIIQDVYDNIFRRKYNSDNVSYYVNKEIKILIKLLQISVPYLELTHKCFFIHNYLRSYLIFTISTSFLLNIIISLLVLLILIKLYLIYKD
jgi:hypothetical protein